MQAEELFEIANKYNGPGEVEVNRDYDYHSKRISDMMKVYSSKGKYDISIGISNYLVDLNVVLDFKLADDTELKNYSSQQVLDFIDKLINEFEDSGYDVKLSFTRSYGNYVFRVLTISWDMNYTEPAVKVSLLKRIIGCLPYI